MHLDSQTDATASVEKREDKIYTPEDVQALVGSEQLPLDLLIGHAFACPVFARVVPGDGFDGYVYLQRASVTVEPSVYSGPHGRNYELLAPLEKSFRLLDLALEDVVANIGTPDVEQITFAGTTYVFENAPHALYNAVEEVLRMIVCSGKTLTVAQWERLFREALETDGPPYSYDRFDCMFETENCSEPLKRVLEEHLTAEDRAGFVYFQRSFGSENLRNAFEALDRLCFLKGAFIEDDGRVSLRFGTK